MCGHPCFNIPSPSCVFRLCVVWFGHLCTISHSLRPIGIVSMCSWFCTSAARHHVPQVWANNVSLLSKIFFHIIPSACMCCEHFHMPGFLQQCVARSAQCYATASNVSSCHVEPLLRFHLKVLMTVFVIFGGCAVVESGRTIFCFHTRTGTLFVCRAHAPHHARIPIWCREHV